MKLYPAIDLRGGQAVRLYQGDYDQMTVYNADPVAQAHAFIEAGAKYLHVVDLDGAKDDTTANLETIAAIARQGGLKIEVGGGIRDEARIRRYLDLGVDRCILGTIAVKDFAFTERMARTYGARIAVGVDMKDGLVAVNGWKEVTPEPGVALLPPLCRCGGQGHHRHRYLPGRYNAGHQPGSLPGAARHSRHRGDRFGRYCPDGGTGRAPGHGLPCSHSGQVHLHRRHRPGRGSAPLSGLKEGFVMITKRIIPCLDVKDGRVVKGVNFEGLQDMADPVEMARFYNETGADELVFYDITASVEGRTLFTDILRRVASQIFIPLTVGGGIRTLEDFDRVLKCGADKVSVNSGAIANPAIIPAAAQKYGNQCVVPLCRYQAGGWQVHALRQRRSGEHRDRRAGLAGAGGKKRGGGVGRQLHRYRRC